MALFRLFRVLSLSAPLLALLSCGGGGGGGGTVVDSSGSPVAFGGRNTAEGFWSGTLSSGDPASMVVLETGETWGIYEHNGELLGFWNGNVVGAGSTVGGSLTDYAFGQPPGAPLAVGGTVVEKTSMRFGASNSLRNVAATLTYNAAYDRPASAADLAGTYVMVARTAQTGTADIVTVDGSGAFSMAQGDCTAAGRATPRASGKNIFDITFNFSGVACPLGNGAMTSGVGYLDTTTAPPTFGMLTLESDRRDGFIAFGERTTQAAPPPAPVPTPVPTPTPTPLPPPQPPVPQPPAPPSPSPFAEQRVNTTTAGAQFQAQTASFFDGSCVAVWASPTANGAFGIVARLFAPDGLPVGGERTVSAPMATDQAQPSVTVLTDGSYVVVWTALPGTGTGGGGGRLILAQRFAPDGSPVGTQQQVNATIEMQQDSPHVIALPGGRFLVAWRYTQETGPQFPGSVRGVATRVFLADGSATPQRTFAADATDFTMTPLFDGGYVLAWSTTSKTRIYVNTQRFDPQGASVGPVTQVTNWGETPALTTLQDGGYLLLWRSLDGFVLGQRYAADGTAVGSPLRPDPSPVRQGQPAAASLDGGDYLVTWVAQHADGSGQDVYAQRYTAAGVPLGATLRVNTTLAGDQLAPVAMRTAARTFVITWASWNQDGDSWGVYSRRFDVSQLM